MTDYIDYNIITFQHNCHLLSSSPLSSSSSCIPILSHPFQFSVSVFFYDILPLPGWADSPNMGRFASEQLILSPKILQVLWYYGVRSGVRVGQDTFYVTILERLLSTARLSLGYHLQSNDQQRDTIRKQVTEILMLTQPTGTEMISDLG